MRGPPLLRGDLAAIVLGLVLLGLGAFVIVGRASSGKRMNFGFGPGWDCAHPGDGDPVCVKKPPPP